MLLARRLKHDGYKLDYLTCQWVKAGALPIPEDVLSQMEGSGALYSEIPARLADYHREREAWGYYWRSVDRKCGAIVQRAEEFAAKTGMGQVEAEAWMAGAIERHSLPWSRKDYEQARMDRKHPAR